MAIQFVTPPAMLLANHYIFSWIKFGWNVRTAKTQHQMNEAWAPKQRDFAASYGEILLAMSVTVRRSSACLSVCLSVCLRDRLSEFH